MEIPCLFVVKAFSYDCNVTSAHISEEGRSVKAFIGVHSEGKSDDSVTDLIFRNNPSVEFLPIGLREIFPNLRHLTVENCGLKSISRCDMSGLENLTELNISSNLTSLPNDLFANMTRLISATIQGPNLKFVSSEILKPLLGTKLQSLQIGRCNFGFMNATARSLEELMEQIDLEFQPLSDERVEPIEESKEVIAEKALNMFSELWNSKRFSGFTVVTGQKEIPVHRAVLGPQSAVFAELFESNSREIVIKDCSSESVESFLKWFYTGRTQELADHALIVEVFTLAVRYEVTKLITICEGMLLLSVDENNALDMLKLGQSYESDAIKSAAFRAIQAMFPERNLNEKLMEEPEKLGSLIEAKKNYEAALERCTI